MAVQLLQVSSGVVEADVEESGRRADRLVGSMAVGVAAIALLNLADILTTRAVLAHSGATESNPLAASLLTGGRVGLLKAGVLLALILRIRRQRPTVAFQAVLWFVAGFYFLTVVNNLVVLQRVS